jgi:hypothetical protein
MVTMLCRTEDRREIRSYINIYIYIYIKESNDLELRSIFNNKGVFRRPWSLVPV